MVHVLQGRPVPALSALTCRTEVTRITLSSNNRNEVIVPDTTHEEPDGDCRRCSGWAAAELHADDDFHTCRNIPYSTSTQVDRKTLIRVAAYSAPCRQIPGVLATVV